LLQLTFLVLPSSIFQDTIKAHRLDSSKRQLPFLEDILEMRSNSAYDFFADVCIENVAGKKDWKGKRTSTTMAEATSPTD
jgi:hypothetical protein